MYSLYVIRMGTHVEEVGMYYKICTTIEIVLISIGKQTIITVRLTMMTFIHP